MHVDRILLPVPSIQGNAPSISTPTRHSAPGTLFLFLPAVGTPIAASLTRSGSLEVKSERIPSLSLTLVSHVYPLFGKAGERIGERLCVYQGPGIARRSVQIPRSQGVTSFHE